jgi:hypothetical protein
VRLTLRTLLAYLDDTLEPSEIKQIGQKVAESDAAQELVARIKQVTRKRRLTTPPLTGPGAKFDPNLIAEYLDNELSGEQVAEIEKICLESDVHLAEIAACHQILTLVLGEPALVPPTARERMYGLVKGREAIPFRKASSKSNPNLALKPGEEAEETAVLGMPVHKRHASWLKWAIPIAAVFLLLALGAALVSALWDGSGNRNKVANADKAAPAKDDTNKDADKPADKDKASDKDKAASDKVAEKDKSADKDKGSDKDKAGDKDKDKDKDKGSDPKPPDTTVKSPDRVPPPSKERKEVATSVAAQPGAPSFLVSRRQGQDKWARLDPSKAVPVYSTDSLVSLPGFASEVRAAGGARLLLWGTTPEFNTTNPFCPYLYESAVTLHANPDGDLDFTLERGRVYVSNPNDKPVRVRVRFLTEVWDVTLNERDTEVVLELVKTCPPEINYQDGEEPVANMTLYVLKGKAGVKYDAYQELPDLAGPTGPALLFWNNKGAGTKGPIPIPQPIPVLAKEPPPPQGGDPAKELRPARGEIAGRMTGGQPVDVMLLEGAQSSPVREQRILCIYGLGAVDAVGSLFDLLASEDKQAGPEREAAIFALRRWVCRGPETTKFLFTPKKGDKEDRGLLIDKGFKTYGAEIVVALLHDFKEVDKRRPSTYEALVSYLNHPKMAIRELGYFHLRRLAAGLKEAPNYDASWPSDRREKAAKEWEDLIAKGKLPPPPPMPMPGGGPSGPPK